MPPNKWNWHHHHERKPAQTTSLDEVSVRRAHRVSIDATRCDLLPPTALDRVIHADHHGAVGQERLEDHSHKLACHRAARPSRLTEHMVVARETSSRPKPHHPQGSAHRALAGREDRTGHKD